MKKYIITEEEYKEVEKRRKENKNKRVERKLQVIKYRYEGLKDVEIAERTGYHWKRISQLCREFKRDGIEEYIRIKQTSHNRNLSYEEEEDILRKYETKAEKGQVVEIKEIKKAFDEKIGKDTQNYIYKVLKRHNWRKIMPRSKHPKKASKEVIETSKKLKHEWKNNRKFNN